MFPVFTKDPTERYQGKKINILKSIFFYVVLSTHSVVLPICHVTLSTCSLVLPICHVVLSNCCRLVRVVIKSRGPRIFPRY